jgi:hypothetical protein
MSERSLLHRLFTFTGGGSFRRWEIVHIRICLKCVLLVFLTWRFWTDAPGKWGLILALSESVASTAVYSICAILLYNGAVDRGNLAREVQRFQPWLRASAWAAAITAWAMGITTAAAHPVLAAFLLILGASLAGSILLFKPPHDRAILSPSEYARFATIEEHKTRPTAP